MVKQMLDALNMGAEIREVSKFPTFQDGNTSGVHGQSKTLYNVFGISGKRVVCLNDHVGFLDVDFSGERVEVEGKEISLKFDHLVVFVHDLHDWDGREREEGEYAVVYRLKLV